METITQILGISICWGQPNHHTHNNKLRMGRPTQGLEAYHDIRGTTLGPVRFLCGLSLSVVVPSWLACIHFINNMTLYICRTLYTAQMKYSCTHFIWHDLIRFKGDIPFNSLHHWNAVNTDADVQRCLKLLVAEQHTGILFQCDTCTESIVLKKPISYTFTSRVKVEAHDQWCLNMERSDSWTFEKLPRKPSIME